MIYLDHAAATPLSKKAQAAMQPFLAEEFFNPSAAYLPAVRVRQKYEAAKDRLAHIIGAKGADLVITSGATESINLAFSATIDSQAEILISALEHPSVRACASTYANCQIIQVSPKGILDIADFKRKLSPKTQFISICLVSSELGSIQPLAEITQLIKAERDRRALAGEKTPLYFHSDASQALGLLELKVNRLGVDLLTLNAAKAYGPKGMGLLYVGRKVKLQPQLRGGGQEMGLRSGTENVPALMAFAAAAEDAAAHLKSEQKRLAHLRQILKKELANIDGLKFLGDPKKQLVNFLPISIPGLDAERLIFMLEEQGLYLSTGAACAANKRHASATLKAINLSQAELNGSLRISMGRLNSEENIKLAARLIIAAVAAERQRLNR